MNIYEKIEEIREKPEHIRMRYVWALVAISMVFVMAIWIFSIWSMTGRNKVDLNEKVEVFEDPGEKLRSLEEYKNEFSEMQNNLDDQLEDQNYLDTEF